MTTSKLENVKYATKINLVMYPMVETQVDIAFATSIVSQFAQNSSLEHFNTID